MVDEPRRRVAIACRILAHAGLIEDVLGHVSVRTDEQTILVRARGPQEQGVLFTEPADVVECSLATGRARAATDWTLPNELPLHLACYRDGGPAVGAVVHAHPPAVVAADLAGVPLVAMFGAYHISAARLAAEGIAVFPRSVLIDSDELGTAMRESMGERPVCILRGHGLVTTGATVEQAVSRALAVDRLAQMACRVSAIGGRPVPIPDADLDQLPDLGAGFNDTLVWRFHERRLVDAGLGVA